MSLLRFSPDERFLCATGADSLLHIWDMETGEVSFGKKFLKPVTMFQWCEVQHKGRRPRYEIVIGAANEVTMNELFFDPTRQQWMLEKHPMAMPTAAASRRIGGGGC